MLDRVRRRGWGLSGRLIASYILVTLVVVVLVEALVLGFQVHSLVDPARLQAQVDAAAESYASQLSQRYPDGVPNFPDPPPSINGKFPGSSPQQLGVSVSRIRAVTGACQSLLPAVRGPAPLTAQDQQDYLRAAACMRSHGITNFPDPVFSGGTVHFPIPSSIDASSTSFTQARQTCERLIPAGLPYSGSGSGS